MSVNLSICRPMPTNACDSATDHRTGDRAHAPEDGFQAPSFVKGADRTCCCAQDNEPDEDGIPHFKNSSYGGYMLAER